MNKKIQKKIDIALDWILGILFTATIIGGIALIAFAWGCE